MVCAKFGWNLPSGFVEEDENVNSYETRQTTDGRRSEKLTLAFSSGEFKMYSPRSLRNKSMQHAYIEILKNIDPWFFF